MKSVVSWENKLFGCGRGKFWNKCIYMICYKCWIWWSYLNLNLILRWHYWDLVNTVYWNFHVNKKNFAAKKGPKSRVIYCIWIYINMYDMQSSVKTLFVPKTGKQRGQAVTSCCSRTLGRILTIACRCVLWIHDHLPARGLHYRFNYSCEQYDTY